MLPFWLVLIFSEYDDEEWDKLIPQLLQYLFKVRGNLIILSQFRQSVGISQSLPSFIHSS